MVGILAGISGSNLGVENDPVYEAFMETCQDQKFDKGTWGIHFATRQGRPCNQSTVLRSTAERLVPFHRRTDTTVSFMAFVRRFIMCKLRQILAATTEYSNQNLCSHLSTPLQLDAFALFSVGGQFNFKISWISR